MEVVRKGLIGFAGTLFLFNAVSVKNLVVSILIAVAVLAVIVFLKMSEIKGR